MLISCPTNTKHCLTGYKPLFKARLVRHITTRSVHHNIVRSADKVIFSGIQPTGVPHIGNYLGALQQWVKLQDTSSTGTKLFFSIVDLHAITTPQDSRILKRWKRETLAILLAVGLNPDRSVLFYQSSVRLSYMHRIARAKHPLQVPAHVELMWILSCTASVGYLSRMTQWKVRSLCTCG
jgi:tryptophanyl-tRNA synthetase